MTSSIAGFGYDMGALRDPDNEVVMQWKFLLDPNIWMRLWLLVNGQLPRLPSQHNPPAAILTRHN